MDPLVSIIIPVYNRASLIGETLASVLAQTYSEWECMVVDDGSIDNTEGVVAKYIEKDKRFRFYRRPESERKGASSCRNYGYSKSKGEYIQFLDSDDLLSSNKIEAQLNKLCQVKKSTTLITCRWGGFENPLNLHNRFKYKYNTYRNFEDGIKLLDYFGYYNEYFPLHVYLIPKALMEKSGKWNENLTNNDDAEFLTRVILNSSRIVFAPTASVYYRYNSENKLSNLNSEEKIWSAIRSWELINEHIKNNHSDYESKYVRNAKFNIFQHVKSQNLYLEKEPEFFKSKIDYNNWYYSILKKFER